MRSRGRADIAKIATLVLIAVLCGALLFAFGSRSGTVLAALVLSAALYAFTLFGSPARRKAHEASEALQESELRMRALLDNAVDGIIVIDERAAIQSVNQAAEKLFQYSKEELIGKNVKMLMPEPYASEHDGYIEHYLTTGRKKIIGIGREVSGRRKDGSTFPMDLSVSEVNLHGRRIFSGMVHDISERKRVEEERKALLARERAARSEAEHANRMKDQFLATLSHELRTPLNAILGWSQIIARGGRSSDEVQHALSTIERNARIQAQLIEDLLSMSRIVSGKLKLELSRVTLSSVIEAAVESIKPAAVARRVNITTEYLEPEALVTGDPARLQQVFWNLLTNAVKFGKVGGEVKVTVASHDSDFFKVSVSDDGKGISRDFLPYVFDRFRQADSSTTRKYGGLGLGLAISKHLIEMHGGTIEAVSAGEGQGATFTTLIPRWVSDVSVAEPGARKEPDSRPVLPAEVELNGVRVLVVDDEPDSRELTRRALEDAKAEVEVAESAAQAWHLLMEKDFDVLLCDIGMPEEDGFEFIKRLRNRHPNPDHRANIPAAALTAFARNEDRSRSIEAGYQMHLSKPIDPAEIVRSVAALTKFKAESAASVIH